MKRMAGILMGACCALMLALSTQPAAAEPAEIALWSDGPSGPRVRASAETVRVTDQGEHVVSGVRQPAIIPYLPAPEIATGAAIIVAPGGGHRELWIDHEGHRVVRWFADRGIAAFVLKYRLSREPGSLYSLEGDSLADMRRAIRLVRHNAEAWRVRPEAVGVMGFSAGGELAALAAWRDAPTLEGARDSIDREDGRAAFAALIYPSIPAHGAFSSATAPTFLLAGERDRAPISEGLAELYLELKRAGASAELHLLADVGHGFGVRDTNTAAVSAWPALVRDWLDAKGFLGRDIAEME